MALGEHRPVGLADEKQHLGEMVVIIIDRKDWQLHPYRHSSLFLRERRLCWQQMGSFVGVEISRWRFAGISVPGVSRSDEDLRGPE
jgi:hypothetical protein